ncbi:hypothetical protein OS493_019238 [Desmophyllum pertusum]|uniref:Uncharacterized protein n=1 Tax=Desmophyllum pertusum TaxID=174260 RepID=A0A9X0CGF3_9CNID|nr:hypothetical protein OS493_019238 [Desmophyllum pertusum]
MRGTNAQMNTERRGEKTLLAKATVSQRFWCSCLSDPILIEPELYVDIFFCKLSNMQDKSKHETQNKETGVIQAKLSTKANTKCSKRYANKPFHGRKRATRYIVENL